MKQDKIANTLGTPAQGNESAIHEDTANQLKMAGEVQRNFLPQQLPNSDKTKWAAIWRPAEWVSGDIYDVTRLDEHHIGFYIADAVGHSMPAALLTMFLKQAIVMRQTTGNDYRIFDPLEVIDNLNRKMVAQELNGCLFATCCYCLLNTETLQLSYARAGHPYPVLLRNGKAEQLENTGGLLGIFEETEFEQSTIQLQAGDKLFLYSDGCENIVGRCDDQGQFHFNDDFCWLGDEPVDSLIEGFEQLVKSQKIQPAEVDDVTAIGLEIL
jgi:sigma-B regulation protein RsbU (phosphoserine phosphatase)